MVMTAVLRMLVLKSMPVMGLTLLPTIANRKLHLEGPSATGVDPAMSYTLVARIATERVGSRPAQNGQTHFIFEIVPHGKNVLTDTDPISELAQITHNAYTACEEWSWYVIARTIRRATRTYSSPSTRTTAARPLSLVRVCWSPSGPPGLRWSS